MKNQFKYCIVKWDFYGNLWVPGTRNNLPEYGKTIQLIQGVELTQGETSSGIFGIPTNLTLKIKIKTNNDLVRQIYDFTENFLTDMMLALDSIPIIKQTPNIVYVTPNQLDEKNYQLLDYNYSDNNWNPVSHYQMGHNLIIGGNNIKGYMSMNKSKQIQLEDFVKKNYHSQDDLTEKAIQFYKIGIKLQEMWKNGSYLTFYKIIENYLKNEYKENIMNHHPNQMWDKIDNKKRLKWLAKHTGYFTDKKKALGSSLYQKYKRKVLQLAFFRDSIAHPDRITDIDSDVYFICKDFSLYLIKIHLK